MDAKTVDKYRKVFGTKEGKNVLEELLSEFGFFDAAIVTEDQRIGNNYAHMLLAKCGVWHPDNRGMMVDSFLNLPARSQENEDNERSDD